MAVPFDVERPNLFLDELLHIVNASRGLIVRDRAPFLFSNLGKVCLSGAQKFRNWSIQPFRGSRGLIEEWSRDRIKIGIFGIFEDVKHFADFGNEIRFVLQRLTGT